MPLDSLELTGQVIQNLASSGNYDLVIGGSTGGLMQFCYNAFQDQGRMITGVVASRYQDDLKGMNCDVSVVEESTFDRSKRIMEEADAMIFMPGGIGTLAEFFGMLEEKRTNDWKTPMILYNEDRSFDPLLRMMDRLTNDGYISKKDQENYKVIYDQEHLFSYLDQLQNQVDTKIVK